MIAIQVFIADGWELFIEAMESDGIPILWYTYDEVTA